MLSSDAMKKSASWQIWSGINLVLIFSFALFLRLFSLSNIPGINGDEAFTTVQMKEMALGKTVTLWVPTQRLLSPIYGAWVFLTQAIFPISFWTVRAPAAIAGITLLL